MEDRAYYLMEKLGDIFDTISVVDRIPEKELPGVLYLVGKVEIRVAPIEPKSFQLVDVKIK